MTAADWGEYDLKKSTASGDWCDEAGAKALKEKIEQFWLARGHAVQVDLREAGFNDSMRSVRFDIRSNLVSGYPPKLRKRA